MHHTEDTTEYERLYVDRSFGEKSHDSFDDNEGHKLTRRTKRSWWRVWRGWILHFALPLVYTFLFTLAIWRARRINDGLFLLVDCRLSDIRKALGIDSMLAPAKYIGRDTHLEVFPLDKFLEGPYTGAPGPELDGVWAELLQCKLTYRTLQDHVFLSNTDLRKTLIQTTTCEYQTNGFTTMTGITKQLSCRTEDTLEC